MPMDNASDDVSLEELHYALSVVAYAITRHGAVYAPILDRLERDIEIAGKRDPLVRARAILAAHTERGGLKAIRAKTSALLSSE